VKRLDKSEVERLIGSTYQSHNKYGLMIKTLFLSGARVSTNSSTIKDIKDQKVYRLDRQQHYPNLDPILSGTVKPHLVRNAWDETVRVIASIEERIVSPSLVLHRLGSYARQNSVYQAHSEIGRVQKRSTF
jgi:TnpA family transposase